MTYPSVDHLQKLLAEKVFGYTVDKKKASGRALGTLVEIITYYTLCAWGLRDSIAIERRIPEYANPSITHNVEFSLHPIISRRVVELRGLDLPLTARKLARATGADLEAGSLRKQSLLTTNRHMRNACVLREDEREFTTANLAAIGAETAEVHLTELLIDPYAVIECKRVGVEEGMRKGPQTIEKAKQGAYVARSVSSLQQIRLRCGGVHGVLDLGAGELRTDKYANLLAEIIGGSDKDLLEKFILTIGIVSNHGNWFTSSDQNKELKVLAQAYDRLLFLTDAGLCRFIQRLLLEPDPELSPAREAFLSSYGLKVDGPDGKPKRRKNCFTKVTMHADADSALKHYFDDHEKEVESWFEVITPKGATITELREDLLKLAEKPWKEIRAV